MATIEEIEDLSVEIISASVVEDNGESEETAPASAKDKSATVPDAGAARVEKDDTSAVAVPGSRQLAEESDDEDDEDIDETILERIVALSEMFPVSVQKATSTLVYSSISTVKGLYSFARSASWILFSTSAILFAPIIFEVERAQMEEMQKQQQRQILLGPGAAMSGGGPGLGPAGLGMAPPPPR